MIGIYKITNKITSEFYIGASKNIKKRWNEHRKQTNITHGTSKVAAAFRKFGIGNFLFEVIEECPICSLHDREEYYINTMHPAYNMSSEGYAIKDFSEDVVAKLKVAGRRVWDSKSQEQKDSFVKNNLKGPKRGHTVSLETREKLRNANLGKKYSANTRALHSERAKIFMVGNHNGNKKVVAVSEMNTIAIEFDSLIAAGLFFGVCPSCISKALNGVQKHAAGLKWFYGSVETNPDECKGVGVILSHVEVQGIRKDEEIVHSNKMVNYWESDKGIVQLAIRSGQFETINVTDVREGELKGRNRLTGELELDWINDDTARMKAKIIGYIGYFKLLSGYSKTTYWSIEELKEHGLNYSQTFKKGFGVWKDNFNAMAKKTVLKLMLNKGDAPMSVEMQQAIKYDQSVILDEDGNHRYVDNQKPSAEDKLEAIAAKEQQMVEDVVAEEVEQANNGELFPEQ